MLCRPFVNNQATQINITPIQQYQIFSYIFDRFIAKDLIIMTFRSLPMQHYMLIVSQDHAYQTMNEISKLQSVHIDDSSEISNKPYVQSVRRCEDCSIHIQMIKASLLNHHKNYEQFIETEKNFTEKLFERWEAEAQANNIQPIKLMDIYEAQINEEYERYHSLTSRIGNLKQKKKEIIEKIACWEVIQDFFGDNKLPSMSNTDYMMDHQDLTKSHLSGINYTIGVIPGQSEMRLNRMIYRVSRGYACVRSASQFQFQGLQQFSEKVIMVIYPSSENKILQRKIMRVLETFCNNIINFQENSRSSSQLDRLKTEYQEIDHLLKISDQDLEEFLDRMKDVNCLEKWSLFIWKEKYIYEQLNKLEVRGQFMLGRLYIPDKFLSQFTHVLQKIDPIPTLQPLPLSKPPTAFDTNCYTIVAQQITDTYGVPRYEEINPSIFTTVTFPFFFGVMFGDAGHGAVLLTLGIFMILKKEWFIRHNMKFISDYRYMVAMMGFFAFYCGFIYNDFIGFNYNFFGSCYDPVPPKSGNSSDQYMPVQHQNCVYVFGIDPIWGRAQNELVFVNGLKMKLSVIIGVIHMTLGICVKAFNARYFKKKLDFFFEFIPQIIFMVLLFGYMDFLIIFKWLKVWDEQVKDIPPRQWAPSIISTMMNVGLEMGKTGTQPDGTSNMWGERGNSSQDSIQLFILVISFVCIPVMLLPKPIALIKQMKKKKKHENPLLESSIDERIQSERNLHASLLTSSQGRQSLQSNRLTAIVKEEIEEQQNDHEDAGQIFVHQLIQTIEFVLGAVSNTASYLRLWALSLAHSQLAKVFFQKTLKTGVEMSSLVLSIPSIIILFWALCWITFGVLMCMDSMECFLHSLRLHWVQFQNKFYKGDGFKYRPISVTNAIILQRASSKS